MAVAVGQVSKGAGAGITTISSSAVNTSASGSTFVVVIATNLANSINTPTDNFSNVYTLVRNIATAPVQEASVYQCVNGIGGASHVITATIGGAAASITAYFMEVTGALTVAPSDGENGIMADVSPYLSPSITTTQADDLLIGYFCGGSVSNPATHAISGASPATGWAISAGAEELNGSVNWPGCLAYRVVTATGTYNSGFTEVGGGDSYAGILTYKAASSSSPAAAVLAFARGTVAWLAASAATTVYTVSGLSFSPQALRFYWHGSTVTNTTTVSMRRGIGFANTTARRCVGTFGLDDAAAMDTDSIAHNAAVAVTTDGAGAITGLLDLNTITSDGFTLIVDDQGVVDTTVAWEAWGTRSGTLNVTIGDIAEPAATGTQVYTATGFVSADANTQVVMLAGVQSTAAVNTGQINDSGLMAGFSTGITADKNIVVLGNNDEGSAAADADGYGRTGECLAMITVAGGNPNARANVTAFGTDSFTLNWWARATTSRRYIYMAIKGGQWRAGGSTIDTTLAGTTSTISELPFRPCGISFISRGLAENTFGVATVQDSIMLATAASISDRIGYAMFDLDGAARQDIQLRLQTTSLLTAASTALGTWEVDLDYMNQSSFRLIVDSRSAGGNALTWYGYLVCGTILSFPVWALRDRFLHMMVR